MTREGPERYVLRGGDEGRARLAVIARVLGEPTKRLLDGHVPAAVGTVIDAGCGGADLAMDLAARVGPGGHVVAFDLDEDKLAGARDEAARRGIANVDFRRADVNTSWPAAEASLAVLRFVLCQVADPRKALRHARQALARDGVVVVQDIDYAGEFCDPPCEAFRRQRELFVEAVRRRGGDPFIGPKLVRLLEDAGFVDVGSSPIQLFGRDDDVKRLPLLTLAGVRDTLIALGVATADEIDRIAPELEAFVERSDTVVSCPRIFQARGRRP